MMRDREPTGRVGGEVRAVDTGDRFDGKMGTDFRAWVRQDQQAHSLAPLTAHSLDNARPILARGVGQAGKELCTRVGP